MKLHYGFSIGCVVVVLASVSAPAWAGGGPLHIDHRLPYDNSGIWARNRQKEIFGLVALTTIGGALWQGSEDRLGRTFWQSTDALLIGGASVFVLKRTFQRPRPSQGNDPNLWFQGCCGNNSFPSGEVTGMAAMITPFVLQYHKHYPWVWALEALPLYDSIARMKTWGHWQTDVLAGWALGTAIGWLTHSGKIPLFVTFLPHGFAVGLHVYF
ncbi:MAG: phosphatase PAP2 family protein [Gammaproteobacteria bacterium]